MPRIHPSGERRPDKASNHSAPPIERHITRRGDRRKTSNLRQAEIIHQKASDGHFRAYIATNPMTPRQRLGCFQIESLIFIAGLFVARLSFGSVEKPIITASNTSAIPITV
jgi:hypothetical protein